MRCGHGGATAVVRSLRCTCQTIQPAARMCACGGRRNRIVQTQPKCAYVSHTSSRTIWDTFGPLDIEMHAARAHCAQSHLTAHRDDHEAWRNVQQLQFEQNCRQNYCTHTRGITLAQACAENAYWSLSAPRRRRQRRARATERTVAQISVWPALRRRNYFRVEGKSNSPPHHSD